MATHCIEEHYLDGELLSRLSIDGIRSWVPSVLDKAIVAIKQAIATWEQRKKQWADKKKKTYAEWHLEYNRDRLQRYIDTRIRLKAKS